MSDSLAKAETDVDKEIKGTDRGKQESEADIATDVGNADSQPAVKTHKELEEKLSQNNSNNLSEKDIPVIEQSSASFSEHQVCETTSLEVGNNIDSNSLLKINPEQTHTECVAPAAGTDEYPVSPDVIDYAKHVTYNDDGCAIYTDPQTKFQYIWCKETNDWIPENTSINPFENEHYKWCAETQKWVLKQTQVTETEHYKWDADTKQWLPKTMSNENQIPSAIVYDIDADGKRTYTDKDGTVFFWDTDKSAWFPKIDDDFMARYQMSYGFIDNTSKAEHETETQEKNTAHRNPEVLEELAKEVNLNDDVLTNTAAASKRKPQQEPPQWFEVDPSRNTKVYVSNLPLDITPDEFADLMGKCGMIMRDPISQKFKLKLYTEEDGQIKGDGLCDYIKVESVDLALKILDEYNLRGCKIRVQRAQFQMRGEYNPALKPKRKKKDKEKLAKIKEKLFDWRPEKMRGERSKYERTVIIKNLFEPLLFEKEVQLILDYQNDLREECTKCGTVKKVVIYDRHSEGVAQVSMSSPEEADLVIQMMQGRFFGKRQLTADHWDGKTKYKVEETQEEIQKRLHKWDQYLETSEKSMNNRD